MTTSIDAYGDATDLAYECASNAYGDALNTYRYALDDPCSSPNAVSAAKKSKDIAARQLASVMAAREEAGLVKETTT